MSSILAPPSEKSLIVTERLILSPLPSHRNLKKSLLISLRALWCVGSGVKMYTSYDARKVFVTVIFPRSVKRRVAQLSFILWIFSILSL